mgnify:CR=1 FL=1
MKKNVSFTGHRPSKFSFGYNENSVECIKLKALLINEIEKLYLLGYKTFLTGCAMGVDMWGAEIVLDLKKKFDDIKLFCIIPFENQCERWQEDYKKRFNYIIENCTQKIILQKEYDSDCYFKRNKFLVKHSTVIISVYDEKHSNSGTKNTLNYALSLNKNIILINPNLLKVFNIKNTL